MTNWELGLQKPHLTDMKYRDPGLSLSSQGVGTISEGVAVLSAKARQKRKGANAISGEQTEVGDRLYKSSERESGGDCRVNG